MRRTTPYVEPTAHCSIERSLGVLGERWTLLILREAYGGATRFADFREALGVAPDLLTARLEKLVSAGVLERREYKAPGERTRHDYHLTPAGIDIRVVLGALQQWGDEHLPQPNSSARMRRDSRTGKPVDVAFVGDDRLAIDAGVVELVRPDAGD